MIPRYHDTFDRLVADLDRPRPVVTGKDIEEGVNIVLTGTLLWLAGYLWLTDWIDGAYSILPYFLN